MSDKEPPLEFNEANFAWVADFWVLGLALVASMMIRPGRRKLLDKHAKALAELLAAGLEDDPP